MDLDFPKQIQAPKRAGVFEHILTPRDNFWHNILVLVKKEFAQDLRREISKKVEEGDY